MKVLVLNCGSSSVKYQLFEFDAEASQVRAKGSVERIGMRGAILNHFRQDGDRVKLAGEILDHQVAIEYILAILLSKNHGVIRAHGEIAAVGHRVVHGGEALTQSVLVDAAVMDKLRECIELAPLHNPHNIKGIEACRRLLPGVPQVAVFDTAFHHTIPDYAFQYALPQVLYRRYGLRRYGFHGTSHFYVSRRAAQLVGQPVEKLNIITCHLGNGCSIAAIRQGKSVDTSMGFTPVEGLVMGTRCGDLDPSAILYIMGREELGSGEANALLNKHSGLMGISGISSDMREIWEHAEKGNDRARLALTVFCYRLKKYIAAYAGVLGGVDVLVFTGGIGENAYYVRERSLDTLGFLGITIEKAKNRQPVQGDSEISPPESRVRVFVIPTNEELVIADDTRRIVEQDAKKSPSKSAAAERFSDKKS
ncbi:MAG: acetate kinase [Calditrichaeota bacterium]|nr:acetate kinase [Calditrichota bacterium]